MQKTVSAGQVIRRAIKAAACALAMFCVQGITAADTAGTPTSSKPQPKSVPNPNLSWAIDSPASTWYLGPNQNKGAEFVVTVPAGSGITSLRITHSTVLDTDTGRGVSLSTEHFHICTSPSGPVDKCSESVKVALNQQSSNAAGDSQPHPARITLWLVADEDTVPNGTFTGNLFIDTEPVTETKTLQLTIQHTAPKAKIWGVVAILAGVVMAWVVTVFARSRINRDQALLLVSVLQQKLEAIKQDLARIPGDFQDSVTDTQAALAATLDDLQTDKLDDQQLLPPSLPAISPSTTQAARLQSFLQTESQIVDNLNVIVTGIKAAGVLAVPTLADPRLAALKNLIGSIDQLSASLPQLSDSLRLKIRTLFDTFNAVPQAQAAGAQAQLLVMPDGSPPNSMHIQMEIQSITLLFWAVWGGLSVLTGFVALVMPTAGFGTVADYLRCLLWGFGLPVAGQGLQSLTMSSLNTQLGVTLPK
jgi:type II secretory pathway pseudopilin PulG